MRKATRLTRRIALLGVLTAMSLVTFVLEGMLPPLFVPGAKLGFSNVFTMITLIVLSPADAVVLVFARTTLGSLVLGGLSAYVYSLTAGMVSVALGSLLTVFVFPKISLIAISATCSIAHNLTQNLVFCVVTATPTLFVYAPYLALIGLFSGAAVGLAAHLVVAKLPRRLLRPLYAAPAPQEQKQISQIDAPNGASHNTRRAAAAAKEAK